MTFSELALYLQKLENTTSRNAMVEILAELFKKATADEIGKLVYLTQGRVVPLYEAVEFGIADKMMIRAVAQAFGVKAQAVQREFGRMGDLGAAAEGLRGTLRLRSGQVRGVKGENKLTISDVHEMLYKIASSGGEGSQEGKIQLLAELLRQADPLSVRYIVRIPLGKLRLGFSDMTVLDSLSWMISGTKEHRAEIERAYNVRPDLGFVAMMVKKEGALRGIRLSSAEVLRSGQVKGLRGTKPKPGVPILMAKAERLSSGKEIIEKIGKCAVEPKIDGFRLQIHFLKSKEQSFDKAQDKRAKSKDRESVRLFTRNLEDVTFMYPDVVDGIVNQIAAAETIFEGEAVAYNLQTGEYLPFQETVQRKRKYNIAETAAKIPLRLICFDLLYLNGENYLTKPYTERRSKLESIVKRGNGLLVSEEHVVDDPKKLETIFQDAISRGLEGVMAKKLDGVYRAGARDWNWIKYKRSYAGKLDDTIDAVVMGYDLGQGKRNTFGIGDFLIGVYEKESDTFKTIAKIGTGLSDEEWREMKKRCDQIKVAHKPARYDVDKMMAVHIWVEPEMVVVIRADEITRSPVHTAGRKLKPSKSGSAFDVDIPGFALRFPRLEQFRSDKSPEDATSLKEMEEMYERQGDKRDPSAPFTPSSVEGLRASKRDKGEKGEKNK